jgi:hypothetical protein
MGTECETFIEKSIYIKRYSASESVTFCFPPTHRMFVVNMDMEDMFVEKKLGNLPPPPPHKKKGGKDH